MGKAQSREPGREAYLVQTLPPGYELGARQVPDNASLVIRGPQPKHQKVFRRSRSLYSLQPSDITMASSTRGKQRVIFERKAKYLGRYQTQAITKTALENLRSDIQQSILKKTKIRLTPYQFIFGTKTGGVLQSDKVAYRSLDLDEIEYFQRDAATNDIMLCVSRTKNEVMIPNGHIDLVYTQNYEINVFCMDPRDVIILQRTFERIKDGGGSIIENTMLSRGVSQQDVLDAAQGWTSAVPAATDSRSWVLAGAQSHKDIRSVNVDNYKYPGNPVMYDVNQATGDRRLNYPGSYLGSQTIERRANLQHQQNGKPYIYNGTLTHEKNKQRQLKKNRNAASMVDLPGASGPVSPSSGHSMTTRVYSDNMGGPIKADVESQANPIPSDSSSFIKSTEASTSKGSRYETRNDNGAAKNGDNESSGSDSTYRGTTLRKVPPSGNTHAGTIDTRAGAVDVVVSNIPHKKETTHSKTNVRRATQNGHKHESHTVVTSSTHTRNYEGKSRENGGAPGATGRLVYYRPVTPDPVQTRRANGHASGPGYPRARSTEPPKMGRMKSSVFVYP